MLKRYGARARAESNDRADELSAAGDDAGAATWRRITDAVSQLENKTPPGPLHLTPAASLFVRAYNGASSVCLPCARPGLSVGFFAPVRERNGQFKGGGQCRNISFKSLCTEKASRTF